MDAKFETKIDAIARDLVDVKVSVARIEGYLESQGGFLPAGKDRTSPEPDTEERTTGYRQAD